MLLFDFIQVACFQGSSIAAWTSFPFIVKLCFVGKKNHILFISLSVDGHLGYFSHFAVMNNQL